MSNITSIFTPTLTLIFSYLPRLVSGILVLIIGLVVASLLKDFLNVLMKYMRIDKWLETAGIAKEKEISIWPKILTEFIRWMVIFIFLMSAVEIWQVPKVADVLSQLLQFLPNVLLAVVIGWIGLVSARLVYDVVRHAVSGLGQKENLILASVARYAIIFFTSLIILTQLGVAADLVKILFTGIVGMLALAGGLAFGLGGADEAKDFLKKLHKKVSFNTDDKPRRN